MTPPKETKKALITDPRENGDPWTVKEFRIVLIKKFGELHEYTDNYTKLEK